MLSAVLALHAYTLLHFTNWSHLASMSSLLALVYGSESLIRKINVKVMLVRYSGHHNSWRTVNVGVSHKSSLAGWNE